MLQFQFNKHLIETIQTHNVMTRKFKILDTNLENIEETHFICETEIGTDNVLFNEETPFRTFKFDGIWVTLHRGDDYIHGELHG